MTVRSRWATNKSLVNQIFRWKMQRVDTPVNKSESLNSSRIAVWILASVSKSMLLVASSKTMMELRRRRARAKAISCLWPWEKLVPPADTFVSSVMVTLVSTSVKAMEGEPSSRSLAWTDGGRDAVRDVAVLCVSIWTRVSTSRHSLSVCSPTK